MLVLGTLMLLGTIFKKTHQTAKPILAEVSLAQPAGSRIESFQNNGKQLYILVKDGNTHDRIVVYSLEDSKTISTITVR